MSRIDKDKQTKVREWLLQPNNNFCALPFIHMAIESNGDIRPCCMGQPLGINIKDKTIADAYNHPIRQEFIDSFKRNEQHPKCISCWKDPIPTRVRYSTYYQSLDFSYDVMNGTLPEDKLTWLEIKPGNKCNLKCRICGVHNSSTWTKDTYELSLGDDPIFLDSNNATFKESRPYTYTQSCDWIEDDNFWNDVSQLKHIDHIHFMGGEPFMVLEHFKLLKNLIESEIDTGKIKIIYNTNGTYYPTDEQIEIYHHFEKIHFSVSIDDIGNRFNYQRKMADWKLVKENIERFRSLDSLYYWQFTMRLDLTISMFNIFYLDEIHREFENMGLPVDHNEHYVQYGPDDIRNLPPAVKSIIAEKYDGHHIPWIAGVVPRMYSKIDDPDFFTEFVNKTTRLDVLRNESFEDTFSEYFDVLKPHWTNT